MKKGVSLLLMTVLLSTVEIAVVIMAILSDVGGAGNSFQFWIIVIGACVISDLAAFWVAKDATKKAVAEERAEFYRKQLEAERLRKREREKNAQHMAETKKLMLRTVEELDDMMENPDKVRMQRGIKSGLDEINARIDTLKMPVFCENKFINALVYTKQQEAHEQGVSIETDLHIKPEVAVDSMDLCRIFSNILDNAISGTVDKKVYIRAGHEKGYLIVTCENPIDKVLDLDNKGMPVSRKGPGHGRGLSNVRAVAEKYDGRLKIDTAGNRFVVTVSVRAES